MSGGNYNSIKEMIQKQSLYQSYQFTNIQSNFSRFSADLLFRKYALLLHQFQHTPTLHYKPCSMGIIHILVDNKPFFEQRKGFIEFMTGYIISQYYHTISLKISNIICQKSMIRRRVNLTPPQYIHNYHHSTKVLPLSKYPISLRKRTTSFMVSKD